jgi:RNA polymerase II subunit A small phosphatase-like protein
LIIFTASIGDYANPVIDFLDPEGAVDLRLFRENCTTYNGVLVKDLSLLKRNLDSVILIDVINN